MEALKRLMTDSDYHDLKKLSSELSDYSKSHLIPLRDTFANEARRAINYNRKIEVVLRRTEDIHRKIKLILGESSEPKVDSKAV